MPNDFCCVPQCVMSGKFNSAISFHHFPKDETLRKIWIRNVRRENLQPPPPLINTGAKQGVTKCVLIHNMEAEERL
uniref:THAP-type domain-containing protein n=1 Tax=Monopterus albus TaxID=43700 RepID=A0A3Q3J3B6_MONAL